MNRRVRASTSARRSTWRSRSRLRGHRRGIADVVATILLLALTVTLFASLFAFVTRFPSPPAQSTDQFQANLITNPTNKSIDGLSILHLAGPLVPINAKVYLQTSVVGLTNWQFTTSGILVNWGLNNTTLPWNLGQVWYTKFSPVIPSYDNITVFVIYGSQLIFSAVLGSSAATFPPVVLTTGTTPSPVAVGAAFQVYVTIGGNIAGFNSTNPLKINFASVPGLSSTAVSMTCSPGPCAGASTWVYNVSAGKTTANGTYYAFVGGNDSGGPISGEVEIVLTGSSSGSQPSSFSATVGINWNGNDTSTGFPPMPNQVAYFSSTVTYSGNGTNTLNVTFYVNQTFAGFTGETKSCRYYSASVQTGSFVVTLYSPHEPSTFPGYAPAYETTACPAAASQFWFAGASVTVSAVAKVGSSTTTASIGPTAVTSFQELAEVATTTTGTLPPAHPAVSHTCTATGAGANCPYILYYLWNNWTGNNATFSGGLQITGPQSNNTTIASTAIGKGVTTSGWLNGLGTHRWKPTAAGTTWDITLWLTIKSTATGTPVIGYLYMTTGTFTVT